MQQTTIVFFFFNDTATTEIYTLSLHDALPILCRARRPLLLNSLMRAMCTHPLGPGGHHAVPRVELGPVSPECEEDARQDRKSTRLNSSHANISYAVFCLKKKSSVIS